jgi:demethylsterigmatocystin 6-O-methyltransferase
VFHLTEKSGAKFYYLRNVLHDWADGHCIRILRCIMAAMGPKSRVLIDDIVLPDTGAHWQATQNDLTNMASLGSRERTRTQWYDLLEAAGLKIIEIVTYILPKGDSIIVAKPEWSEETWSDEAERVQLL